MRPIRAAVSCLLLAACGASAPAGGAAPPAARTEGGLAEGRYLGMGHGLNLHGWFWPARDAADPDHARSWCMDTDLALIRSLGFRHVRLPVDPEYLLDEARPDVPRAENLARVDAAIDRILAAGLNVTVDMHASFVTPDGSFTETKPFETRLAEDPAFFRKFVAFWRALAAHFSVRDPERFFIEILNEPQYDSTEVWDRMQADLVRAIRSGSPRHTIVATGAWWGGPEGLFESRPVDDTNVVYSVHLYEPLAFTSQGAEWMPEYEAIRDVPYPSSPESVATEVRRLRRAGLAASAEIVEAYGQERWDARRIDEAADSLAAWGRRHGVRVAANEFGAYHKAPAADRIRFIGDLRRALEIRGIAWNMWDYSAGGFGIFGDGSAEAPRDAANVNVALLGALGLPSAPPRAAAAAPPALRVAGNRIVDAMGAEVRLRGVNIQDPFVLENDDFDGDGPDRRLTREGEADFARIASWGANVVRLQVYPGFAFHVGLERYFDDYLDRAVDLAERHGMYAVIDYHPIGRPDVWYEDGDDSFIVMGMNVRAYDSDLGRATAFWEAAAARYGGRSHVLFEIWNEPTDEDDERFNWADWRPYGEKLIRTVRRHSGNVVIASGPHWTSDLSEVPTAPFSDTNLAYSVHVYPNGEPWEDPAAEWERLFGSLAETYPVFVTEWGFNRNAEEETYRGTRDRYARPLLAYLDARGISWTAHMYYAESNHIWERDWRTPTEFGAFVREALSKRTRTSP